MRRVLPWVIASVFIVVSIILGVLLAQEKQSSQVIALMLSATKTTTPTSTPTSTFTPTSTETATVTPTPTNTATATLAPTINIAATLAQLSILATTYAKTTEPNRPTDVPKSGTRDNPILMENKLFLVNDNNQNYTLSITKVVRGADASAYIAKLYGFSRDPLPGSEFLVATLHVNYYEGSGVLYIDRTWFEGISQGRVILTDSIMYTLPSGLKAQEKILSNGKLTADLVFQVDPQDKNPLIAFGLKSDGTGGFFFNTK